MCGPKTKGSAINPKTPVTQGQCVCISLWTPEDIIAVPVWGCQRQSPVELGSGNKGRHREGWKSQSEHGRVFTGQADRSGAFSTTRVCVPETSAARPPLRVSLSRTRGHRELLQVDGSQVWGQPFSQGGPPASRGGMCPRLAPRPWGWRPLSLVPVTKGN